MNTLRHIIKSAIWTATRTRAGKLAIWKALPACGIERFILRTGDGLFAVSARDNMIALELFTKGFFDKHLVDQSCQMTAEYLGGTASLIYVDVGANIGTNTVYALQHPRFQQAICFEPGSENYMNLVDTIAANALENCTRAAKTALGDADGVTQLALSTVNFGDNWITEAQEGEETETIPVTTLDAALTVGERERVGLISVDVQGYEGQMLAGAYEILQRDIPFLCELKPDDLNRCGGNDLFFGIVENAFSWFIDMRQATVCRPIDELRVFAATIPPGGHTDVFLTKRRPHGRNP